MIIVVIIQAITSSTLFLKKSSIKMACDYRNKNHDAYQQKEALCINEINNMFGKINAVFNENLKSLFLSKLLFGYIYNGLSHEANKDSISEKILITLSDHIKKNSLSEQFKNDLQLNIMIQKLNSIISSKKIIRIKEENGLFTNTKVNKKTLILTPIPMRQNVLNHNIPQEFYNTARSESFHSQKDSFPYFMQSSTYSKREEYLKNAINKNL